MVHIRKADCLEEEAKFIKEKKIDLDFIEIFAGEKNGTSQQIEKLNRFKKELGNKIYIEFIYVLTHEITSDEEEAKKKFNSIIAHQKMLSSVLNRNIGIQVASLDYLTNIKGTLKKPLIMEEDKILSFARAAIEDDKTNIYDKKLLFHELNREIERARRYGSYFSLLFMDIDELKQINDTYGHLTGDEVILKVGEVLKKNVRVIDTAYRFGGDEFVVLAPNTSENEAGLFSRKIIENIRKINIKPKEIGSDNIRVSVSIGVASFNMDNLKSISETLEAADKAVYMAKRLGKNRIYVYEEKNISEHEETKKDNCNIVDKKDKNIRLVIRGIPISPGLSIGNIYVYKDILERDIEYREISVDEVEPEFNRIQKALGFVKDDIEEMGKEMKNHIGKEFSDLFDFHWLVLNDQKLIDELKTDLKLRMVNAENVVKGVFKKWEGRFRESGSDIIKERGDDILDLSKRVLRYLMGIDKNIIEQLPENTIVISKRLLPSDTVYMKRRNVVGMLTEEGSKSSHAALLAKSMRIPYICQFDYDLEDIPSGQPAILNADSGEIVINPDKHEISSLKAIIKQKESEWKNYISRNKNIELKKDNKIIKVLSNVNSREEVVKSLEYGSSAIGLFRLEQLYMQHKTLPSETQLYDALDKCFSGLKGSEITARLLDINNDKTIPYLSFGTEQNSSLGLRGVRMLLGYPQVLETELRVFLKLSAKYKLKILIPMVTIPDDVLKVRQKLNECKNLLKLGNIPFNENILLGAMIEVPAAVLKIDEILNHADFVSIGTNDLIQYTTASGRENSSVSSYYEAGSEMVMEYIERVIKACNNKGKECVLCGDMASDVNYTKDLLKLGLENFSVPTPFVPIIRNKISELLRGGL
ncbi:MAG: phosphoenolpyruvate--protein phosphotransferase [Elusimicrobia bacterium]|nr:phosphoenolpyruvate--protein phosphotransferase [Candidatus Liberimonas magnetica]